LSYGKLSLKNTKIVFKVKSQGQMSPECYHLVGCTRTHIPIKFHQFLFSSLSVIVQAHRQW